MTGRKMEKNVLNDDKLKIRLKKKLGNIDGTNKSPNLGSSSEKLESDTDQNAFTIKRDASYSDKNITATSSFPTNPRNHRRVLRDDFAGNERIKIGKGNSNIFSPFKDKAISTTKTENNTDPVIKIAQNNVAGGSALIFDESRNKSITKCSTKTSNSKINAAGIKKKMVYHKEKQNFKLKGVQRIENSSHDLGTSQIHKFTKFTSDANSHPKKTNILKAVKKIDSIRHPVETKKNLTELNSHKKNIKLVEKENLGKTKQLTLSHTGLNVSERQCSTNNERHKNVISEAAKKSSVSHIDSSKKGISISPPSTVSSCDQNVKKKSDCKGRERTKTWTICSTSGDLVEDDSHHKKITVYKGMEDELFYKKGDKLKVSDIEKNIQLTTRLKVKGDAHITEGNNECSKVNCEIINEDIKGRYDGGANAEETIESSQEEYTYEDDFEEYESDFEECSQEDDAFCDNFTDDDYHDFGNKHLTRDEKVNVLSEGIVSKCMVKDLVSSELDSKDNNEDGQIKMNLEFYDFGCDERQQEDVVASLKMQTVHTDGGFDNREEMMKLSKKLETMPENNPGSSPQSHVNCMVHFCKRNPLTKKEIRNVCRRGKQLLKMISLDDVSFLLFELPSIPYETLMRSCGAVNMKQISVQTNEDSLTEGIQTHVIMKCDAWTQKPPILGASCAVGKNLLTSTLDTTSWNNLGRFVKFAAEVIMIILEEQRTELKTAKQELISETLFSKFSIKLGQDGTSNMFWEHLYSSRPVRSIRFCETQTNLLVCAHGPVTSELETNKNNSEEEKVEDIEAISESSLLSIWRVNEPSHPMHLLSCQGNVSSTCFGGCFSKDGQLMFAGTDEGIVCLWDFYDKGVCHEKIFTKGCLKDAMECPTFSTTGGENHLGRIIGLEPVVESKFYDEDSSHNNMKMANQVCSLDEWGTTIIWSVIKRSEKLSQTVGLVASMQISLGNITLDWEQSLEKHGRNLKGDNIRLSHGSGNSMWKSLAVGHNCVFAGSDSGDVVCLPLDGDNRSVQVYLGSRGSFASAECIAVSPQGLPFFLVGNSIGQVQLYSQTSTKHFISWEPASESLQPIITNVAWSPHRPFVFFTVDAHSRVTLWDLAFSDIFPLTAIPSPKEEKITAISLSFSSRNDPAYMAIGNDHGHVTLHQLKEELTCKDEETRKTEVSRFLKYANLL